MQDVVQRHRVSKLQVLLDDRAHESPWYLLFHGFMVNFAHTNWNVVIMVFGSINPKESMESMDRTCDWN